MVDTVKERPILFSSPMVRAILAGTKTQTRRIVRNVAGGPGGCPSFACGPHHGNIVHPKYCPHGSPGDKLWVREKWTSGWRTSEKWTRWGTIYAADLSFREHASAHEKGPHFNHSDETFADIVRWRPSIFMPRHASRITLEVTGVRAERLQAITEDDAKAEGVEPAPFCKAGRPPGQEHVEAFEELWDKINGKRASWSSNPFVWVVEFTRVLP